jgi:hypothetical protein
MFASAFSIEILRRSAPQNDMTNEFLWFCRILWFWMTTLLSRHVRAAMNRRAIGQHPINGVCGLF